MSCGVPCVEQRCIQVPLVHVWGGRPLGELRLNRASSSFMLLKPVFRAEPRTQSILHALGGVRTPTSDSTGCAHPHSSGVARPVNCGLQVASLGYGPQRSANLYRAAGQGVGSLQVAARVQPHVQPRVLGTRHQGCLAFIKRQVFRSSQCTVCLLVPLRTRRVIAESSCERMAQKVGTAGDWIFE